MAIEFGWTNRYPRGESCGICREPLRGRALGHLGHVFHRTCVLPHLTERRHCPTCRGEVINPLPLAQEGLKHPIYRVALRVQGAVRSLDDATVVLNLRRIQRVLIGRRISEGAIELFLPHCKNETLDTYESPMEAMEVIRRKISHQQWVDGILALRRIMNKSGLRTVEEVKPLVLRAIDRATGRIAVVPAYLECMAHIGEEAAAAQFFVAIDSLPDDQVKGWIKLYLHFVRVAHERRYIFGYQSERSKTMITCGVDFARLYWNSTQEIPTEEVVWQWADQLHARSTRERPAMLWLREQWIDGKQLDQVF